jgi:hypothetical protein
VTSAEGDSRPFRILSLDGGGLLGTFTAAFLADIESRLGQPLASYFDLIAGTSTGGIIAAALAMGERAERIEKFYLERGPKIFRRCWELPDYATSGKPSKLSRMLSYLFDPFLKKVGFDHFWLWYPKYDNADLRGALEEVFGDRTLEEAKYARLVIPAVDLTRGQTVVFKTPHLARLIRDRKYRVVDVVLSTTAAPTYFPHANIGEGSAFVDGGLWANNPTMVGVAEAIEISEECRRPDIDPVFKLNDVQVLSIGTGKSPFFAAPPKGGAGTAWWAPRIVNLVMASQAQGIDFQSRFLLGDRYYRVNYDVPDGSWSIDNVRIIGQLAHYGRMKAAEHYLKIHEMFLRQTTTPYTAYPLQPAG